MAELCEHVFVPVPGQTGCRLCGYARGQHPTAQNLARAEKQRKAKIDRQVQEIVSRRCQGLQINILDIGEVFRAAYAADSGVTGQDVEAAVVETYSRLARKVS